MWFDNIIFYSRRDRHLHIHPIEIVRGNKKDNIDMYLNITSLNSGLLTNLGSIRDPFAGCGASSCTGLIGSHPKHVANISANNNVVPSFCNVKKQQRKEAEGKWKCQSLRHATILEGRM